MSLKNPTIFFKKNAAAKLKNSEIPGGKKTILEVKGKPTYLLGDELGSGAFGRVYRGLNVRTGEMVAVKEIDQSVIPTAKLPQIKAELEILQRLYHPNVVRFIEWVETETHMFFVMEYVEGGSLRDLIKRFGNLDENLLLIYLVQVIRGLKYLHGEGIVHRDIKAANILLTKDGSCKLADFGSCGYAALVESSELTGSPFWMAPELIHKKKLSFCSDSWSVGCTIIELLTGNPPYFKLGTDVALYRMTEDEHPPIPAAVSPGLGDFLSRCFVRDTKKRPAAADLLSHSFVTSLWGAPPDVAAGGPASSSSGAALAAPSPSGAGTPDRRVRSRSVSISEAAQAIFRRNSRPTPVRRRGDDDGSGSDTDSGTPSSPGRGSGFSDAEFDAAASCLRHIRQAAIDVAGCSEDVADDLVAHIEDHVRVLEPGDSTAVAELKRLQSALDEEASKKDSLQAAIEMVRASTHSLHAENRDLRSKLYMCKDLAGRVHGENTLVRDEIRALAASLTPEGGGQLPRDIEVRWIEPGAKCLVRLSRKSEYVEGVILGPNRQEPGRFNVIITRSGAEAAATPRDLKQWTRADATLAGIPPPSPPEDAMPARRSNSRQAVSTTETPHPLTPDPRRASARTSSGHRTINRSQSVLTGRKSKH